MHFAQHTHKYNSNSDIAICSSFIINISHNNRKQKHLKCFQANRSFSFEHAFSFGRFECNVAWTRKICWLKYYAVNMRFSPKICKHRFFFSHKESQFGNKSLYMKNVPFEWFEIIRFICVNKCSNETFFVYICVCVCACM